MRAQDWETIDIFYAPDGWNIPDERIEDQVKFLYRALRRAMKLQQLFIICSGIMVGPVGLEPTTNRL